MALVSNAPSLHACDRRIPSLTLPDHLPPNHISRGQGVCQLPQGPRSDAGRRCHRQRPARQQGTHPLLGRTVGKKPLPRSRSQSALPFTAAPRVQDLVLSEDLKGVRRRVPVPEYDIAGMQRRILVVENLPALPTIGERRSRARACMTHRR